MEYEGYQSRVSVITINYNQNHYTLECIRSILQSDYSFFNIILIDNGSNPDKFELLKTELPDDHKLILKRLEENTGYVGGINTGIKEALGKTNPDYFLIMNNDTLIEPDAIRYMVDTCSLYDNQAIITGKVMDYHKQNIIQTTGTIITNNHNFTGYFVGQDQEDKGQYDCICERDIIDDIFWLLPSRIVNDIGVYSNWFYFGYEQAEYALRAKKRGYKLVYTYKAKLYHKGNASVNPDANTPFKTYWGTFGFLVFRYLFQRPEWFLLTYIRTFSMIVFQLGAGLCWRKYRTKYPQIKFLALFRFNIWLFKRIDNSQYVPVLINNGS